MIYLILLSILSFVLLTWILFFIVTIYKYNKIPVLTKNFLKKTSISKPLLSVVIPSRNEVNKIGKCIKSLKVQTYINLEFLIVDDSEDDTVKIIKSNIGTDQRFRIIKQKKILSGWIGKTFALQQGSGQASGEWLIFIDADTYHDPVFIERAYEYAINNNLDMLSILLNYICKSFWEKIILPIPLGLIIFYFPIHKVNDPKSKAALASGPFILMKRSVFNKIGGYETIKNYIADDVEMGKLVKSAGFKIGLINAQTLASVRMYENFKEIWYGWSKNIFLGRIQRKKAQSKKLNQILLMIFGEFGIFSLLILPFLTIIISLILTLLTNQSQFLYLLIFSSMIWLFATISQYFVCKLYHIGDPKYVPLIFLGAIIFMGIFLNSGIQTLSGKGVTWKGRKYSTKL